jgi:hypothetical protein
MLKLLAVGIDKNFKTWSIPVEVEKVEDVNVDQIAGDLYKDEKSGHTLPTSIAVIKVDGEVPILQESFRFVDDSWEEQSVEPWIDCSPEQRRKRDEADGVVLDSQTEDTNGQGNE